MSTARAELRKTVSSALGRRRLIWAGIRGDDAESLSDLAQFDASFTIINAYDRRPLHASIAYEDMTGTRPDLETWDIDDHPGDGATIAFRRALLRAMSVPCALLPYRPSQFLSALAFARADRCLNLGLFGSQQFAFEHKPWVESAMAKLGVPSLGWRYIADEDQLDAERLLADGPVMVRRSRTSGGVGLAKVASAEELAAAWPRQSEAFASVSPYLADALPINVGATVWDDGVTVHLPSVQLIGVAACVSRPFGYCGNDFAAVKDLDPAVIDAVEATTITVGEWLRSHGYRGTFGADYLLRGGVPVFTEVNPRFQGSTRASAQLAVEVGQPCLPLEHLGAMLGVPRPERPPLRTLVREMRDLAQVVVHNTRSFALTKDLEPLRADLKAVDPKSRMDVVLPPGVNCEPGATLARFAFASAVTRTGYDLREDVRDVVLAHTATDDGADLSRERTA